MPPELLLPLTLAAKMAVTAAFVVLASYVAERAGPAIGALVATLPIAAGPSYVFLALDHDAAFIAESAIASLCINAVTVLFGLAYVLLAQRHGPALSIVPALGLWLGLAALVRWLPWSLTAAIIANALAFAVCLPLAQRYRVARMPPVARRWYDVPLRAFLVAGLVAILVTSSSRVGATISGIIALFPIVFTSLMLILHPRIGGAPTAAVIANALWGLIGFGIAVVVLQVAVVPLGPAIALPLALAVSAGWNLGLWQWRRRRLAALRIPSP